MKTIRELRTFIGVEPGDKWGPVAQAALEKIIGQSIPDDTELVDARSESNITTLHPRVRTAARKLVRAASDSGITIKVISGTRTYAEQDHLYEQGRTRPGNIVTNARGGYSNHNFGIAFDIGVFSGTKYVPESPAYRKVGKLGKSLGLKWGGDWTGIQDEPHFELRPEWADGEPDKSMMAELRFRKTIGKDAFA